MLDHRFDQIEHMAETCLLSYARLRAQPKSAVLPAGRDGPNCFRLPACLKAQVRIMFPPSEDLVGSRNPDRLPQTGMLRLGRPGHVWIAKCSSCGRMGPAAYLEELPEPPWTIGCANETVLTTMKIGRNQICLCGSGQKYKRCCGRLSASEGKPLPRSPTPDVQQMLGRHQAAERIREAQQGLGRPIVSFRLHDHQLVAVGKTLHWSLKWKTFSDFLSEYLKQTLDPQWGNAELAKPLAERHPILKWYDAFCHYQRETIKTPGEVSTAVMNGVTACYLGLAYSLYLLAHNVELQDRLVRRLKDVRQFQGAYYELIVANILIRAGFTLTLEDETDGLSKHCEFAAVSKRTGKKYWVEAKMRAVSGLLGKGDQDGASDTNPISQLIPHLNGALKKPATDERLIFIDLNTDAAIGADGKPAWGERAITRLDQYEDKELQAGVTAYVFVTNLPFHRMLQEHPVVSAIPLGLGMPDFNRPGSYRLSEVYRLRQKHIDAHEIGIALTKYAQLPSTFDGGLPSESFGGCASRVIIGETYFFESLRDGGTVGTVGTVTTATVDEQGKEALIGIVDQSGTGLILRKPMSEQELADYQAHSDAYFGRVRPVQRTITDPYELFEWLMECNKGLPRKTLLDRSAAALNIDALKCMSDEDLLALYCEGMVAACQAAGFRTTPGPTGPTRG
jgi:SEC-C motif